jgi:LuxR family maltose regulon positive regulatory protein
MVPRLVSAAASVQPPVTVLLDQAEAVTNRQCLNAIAEFALRLPHGWRFALASRTAAPLPTARLRAQGGLLEVTADDLAMSAAEADALLQGAGVKVGEASLDDLLQRTEGWPTGLYIAALAMNSQQCTLAALRNSWSEVTSLTQRAVAIVEAGHFEDYFTSAVVYAWAARAALHEGNSSQGRRYLGRASRLRPLLTYMLPVVSVQALLEMAHSYIALADRAGAAAVLTEARSILQQRPDLGLLPAQADRLEARLATIEARAAGPSALTAAELRVLPLLSTHLPVSEIAAELFLSPHTVKSEMKSIYRKLGATSRTQAVTRSRELGLLGL